MSGYVVYAMRVADDWAETIHESLTAGEGRFGWSYIKDADLKKLARKVEKGEELTEDQRNCAQWFLLDVAPGDYVVYINVPSYGQCTVAKVTDGYFWRRDDDDFNHRFGVDAKTVRTFERNAACVPPYLRNRLKFQGRYWRVLTKDKPKREFELLLAAIKDPKALKSKGGSSNLDFLEKALEPILSEVTKKIQHTHPRKDLEKLCAEVFRRLPGVKEVVEAGHGRKDKGADLIVRFDTGLPIPSLQHERTLLVQVKSFEGEHWDPNAVEDLRRALKHYKEAEMALIISTATKKTETLDKSLEELRKEVGIPIGLLIGEDVAKFFIEHAGDLLGVHLK